MSNVKKAERLFGTDGIRGRYGEGWLTPERVEALAQVIGAVLCPAGKGRALLGHDGRRSGPLLEAALMRGLAKSGVSTSSAGLITTPALALAGALQPFDLTVMISASHNPARDNGIKVFGPAGTKVGDDVERQIEERVQANLESLLADVQATETSQGVPHDSSIESEYLDSLSQSFADLKLSELSIVVDAANGGGSRIAARALGRLGARVISFADTPDGENINENCGSTHPGQLMNLVQQNSADLGIALDGDGDRCMLVDAQGNLVHGDGILTVLARYAAEEGQLADPRIVATVMSNKGLHKALAEVGVSVLTTVVGDRAVVEAMRAEGLQLGGEQSGHIICGAEHHFIGDGIYTALRVLRVMCARQLPLASLTAPYIEFPQVLLNLQVSRKPPFDQISGVQEAVALVETELGEDGRVLLRYSGTESLARVMVEGPSEALIAELAERIALPLRAAIGV